MSRSFKEYLTAKEEAKLQALTAEAETEIDDDELEDDELERSKKKKKKKKPVDKETEVDVEPETNDDEDKDEDEAKYPHDMFHPKTGEKKVAKDEAEHEALSKLGYTHEDPKAEDDKETDSGKDIQRHNPKKYVNIVPVMSEALSKTAVVSWGRMNPVTIGHEKLINAVIKKAVEKKGTPLIYLSHSEDKKKNPLPYDQKILFAKAALAFLKMMLASRRLISPPANETAMIQYRAIVCP